jgi:nucleoside-diphosphate-sugar epimerase
LSAGHDVFAMARSGAVPPLCTPVRADLAAPLSAASWPRPLDAVVHLAQSMRHREFPDGAADMTAVNVTATAALLEHARSAGASVFVLASTGNVYTPGPKPLSEDAPVAPATYYAASKIAAESLVRPYGALMRVCALRLFYPYGPGQQNRLVPSLIARVRTGTPIMLPGTQDGLAMTPTYLDDVVDVLRASVEDARFAGTLNVSAPWVVSLREAGEAIGRALGRDVRFEQGGGPEPARVIPSLDRLGAIYPLDRCTPLDAGLARMLREEPVAT